MQTFSGLSRFRSAPLVCLGALVALLLPVLVFPGDEDASQSFVERALKRVRKDTMAPDAADQLTAGYYEDLFEFSSRTISTNRLITGKWATNWSRYRGLAMNPTDQRVDGFIYFEMKPNLDVKEFQGRLVTNRYGMADREYSVERAQGVRRISFIGDSITRGLGATYGKTFEAVLEEKLNALEPRPGGNRYELLNFAVGGYRITQMLWVLEKKAAPFHPQVHVIVFSDLTSFRKWGDHITQLVHDGIDLHYPYLKELARSAALRPDDDPQTFDAKLAPHRQQVVRWALETMKASAAKQGAQLVVLMVPPVQEAATVQPRFVGVKELAESLDIPLVDVTDTFVGIDDLSPYRIGPFNAHPTDAGHARLAERIFERLRENRRAWAIVTGPETPGASRTIPRVTQ